MSRIGRMPIAIPAGVTVVVDVFVQLLQLGEQPAAAPDQRTDQQQQGDEQPGTINQAGAQLAYARAPGHGGQLAFKQRRHLLLLLLFSSVRSLL